MRLWSRRLTELWGRLKLRKSIRRAATRTSDKGFARPHGVSALTWYGYRLKSLHAARTALPQSLAVNVAFWSKADVKASVGDVCFAPRSRLQTASWHVSVGPQAEVVQPPQFIQALVKTVSAVSGR